MSAPIVDGGTGLGSLPGSDVKMTGDAPVSGIVGTTTGAVNEGPGAIGFLRVPTRFASGNMLIGTGGVHPLVPIAEDASPSRTSTLDRS